MVWCLFQNFHSLRSRLFWFIGMQTILETSELSLMFRTCSQGEKLLFKVGTLKQIIRFMCLGGMCVTYAV